MNENKKTNEELIVRVIKELRYDRPPISKYSRDAAFLYIELGKGGQKWGKNRLKILSEELSIEIKTLQRKTKLAELIDDLLELVDSGNITEEAGYHLAFLDVKSQERVLKVVKKLKIKKIDGETGERIKKSAVEIQRIPKKCSIDSETIEKIIVSQEMIRECKRIIKKERK